MAITRAANPLQKWQIENLQIIDEDIADGAAIATSKLADGNLMHDPVTVTIASAAFGSIDANQELTLTEPTWDALPDKPYLSNITVQGLSGTTVSWDANDGINATLTLSGNTTITLSNLVSGTSGNIKVTNHASSSYTLTVSGYTNKICPAVYSVANILKTSGGSSKIDVYSWWYDGTNLIWNGSLDYK